MATRKTKSVKLQPADPFDLIRWLARTQSDPRKAVAELVQNSLDARAREIRIERRRIRGIPALLVRDDGEGVLPDRNREEALRFIATHIGHSHKLGLSPRERTERVIAGKYGVGLLGFWSVGHRMEMRSRVAGSALHVLRLVEDRQEADILQHPLSLDAPGTFTEILILELHDAALRALAGRRLTDYLSAELRGPLIATGASVTVHDGLIRGGAQKTFTVVPRRFSGERLALPPELPVEGRAAARIELYLARGAERPAIEVSCGGTLVADDFAELGALGLDRPPWVGRDLTGLVEFGGFQVPPGTRRGVIPDAAAAAFTAAMRRLAPVVEEELARIDRERRGAVGRQLVQELRRALRGFRSRLPQYDLPRVDDGGEGVLGPGAAGRQLSLEAEEGDGGARPPPDAAGGQPELFPPGPLASVRIAPERIEIGAGSERRVRALAFDRDDRALREGIDYLWSLAAPELAVRGEGPRPAVVASTGARVGVEAELRLKATQGDRSAEAAALVVVADAGPDIEAGLGVPEPELVDEPAASWRSRFDGDRWQVNAAHEDYVALKNEGRARLRYLLALLAKEIVQRTYGGVETAPLLEHLVEVLAHAERNLKGG